MAIRRTVASGRIVRDPRVLHGEPIVQGTRLTVRSIVLASRELGGAEGVLDAYPQLTLEDVDEAMSFYAAHRDEIDRYIATNLADD